MSKVSSKNISILLKERGFSLPLYIKGCCDINHFFENTNKVGIYILHFSDDTKYVGKSIDILKRFKQHNLNYNDIDAISFKPVTINKLDEVEQKTIAFLESNNIQLRNIMYSSFTYEKTPFFDLISQNEQKAFLENLNYNVFEGERIENEELRKKYNNRFIKFYKKNNYSKIISLIKKYILNTIPFPKKTEVNYWSISCLPGGDNSVLCRVNVNWQEIFTVYRSEEVIWVSFHLAENSLPFERLSKIDGVNFYDHRYIPGGDNQVNLQVNSIDIADKILDDKEVISACKQLNLNLMRKGLCAYRRYHCPQIVDNIFNENF